MCSWAFYTLYIKKTHCRINLTALFCVIIMSLLIGKLQISQHSLYWMHLKNTMHPVRCRSILKMTVFMILPSYTSTMYVTLKKKKKKHIKICLLSDFTNIFHLSCGNYRQCKKSSSIFRRRKGP